MGAIDSILNSIKSLWAYVRAIPTAIDSVITWVNKLISSIENDFNQLYVYIAAQAKSDLAYALSLYQALSNYAVGLWNDLYAWTANELTQVYNWASGLINQVIGYLGNLEDWVGSQISGLISWINNNIVGPIWNALQMVVGWVTTYGAFVVNLLTHPDQLAALIGKYVLVAWRGLGAQFAKPFFSWFLASAISLGTDLSGILEDVISSLFD